jgi:acetyl/propionyl-CoA carboxylase alpha subunit
MDYEFETTTGDLRISVKPGEPGQATAHINGRSVDFGYGVQVSAWIDGGPGTRTVILDGERYLIRDRRPGERPKRREAGAGQGQPSFVTPPMPAIVIRVTVSEGDSVATGDTVAVVSAMKMETSLRAPYPGRVSRVRVAEGDRVMPGDVLVEIEPRTGAPPWDDPGHPAAGGLGTPPKTPELSKQYGGPNGAQDPGRPRMPKEEP